MTITWQVDELPAEADDLGHGVCVLGLGEAGEKLRVVAIVEGFGWLKKGADAVVRFDPRYFPAGDGLHLAIETLVRTGSRRLDGVLIPGFRIHTNG